MLQNYQTISIRKSSIDLPRGRDPFGAAAAATPDFRRRNLFSAVGQTVCLPVSHQVEIDLCFHFLGVDRSHELGHREC